MTPRLQQNASQSNPIWVFAVFMTLLPILAMCSIFWGSAPISAKHVLAALFQFDPDIINHNIIWQLRLPRTALAMIVGVHFALAGVILQSVIRNPLADPSVIGVTGGSSLAIVVFLLLADMLTGSWQIAEPSQVPLTWLPIAALVGGISVAFLVLSMSWRSAVSPAKLALYGVAIGSILNALVMWIIVTWGGSRTETSILWLAGSLYGRDFTHIRLILPWTLCALFAFFIIIKPLSVMRFDSSTAHGLGFRDKTWRSIAIFVAVAFAASAISVTGPVGFVGLIVPHIARSFVGSDIGRLASLSAIIGACLTLVADVASRLLLSPLELPMGALTTLLGIPVLLITLQRQIGTTQ